MKFITSITFIILLLYVFIQINCSELDWNGNDNSLDNQDKNVQHLDQTVDESTSISASIVANITSKPKKCEEGCDWKHHQFCDLNTNTCRCIFGFIPRPKRPYDNDDDDDDDNNDSNNNSNVNHHKLHCRQFFCTDHEQCEEHFGPNVYCVPAFYPLWNKQCSCKPGTKVNKTTQQCEPHSGTPVDFGGYVFYIINLLLIMVCLMIIIFVCSMFIIKQFPIGRRRSNMNECNLYGERSINSATRYSNQIDENNNKGTMVMDLPPAYCDLFQNGNNHQLIPSQQQPSTVTNVERKQTET